MIKYKNITMKYDSTIYHWIAETGRLTDTGKLEWISSKEPRSLENIKEKQTSILQE